MSALLDIRALSVTVAVAHKREPLPILRDVAVAVSPGETLGIVGESGSGKSMLALAVLGLLPHGAAAAGEIRLAGRNLLGLSDAELSAVRGRRIGMIFQEPMTALNPAMRVGAQIAEGLVVHQRASRQAADAEALRLLERVRIREARRRTAAYPHELSGGERQRVAIAIALALQPDLLLADEPTTALDTTVQADILDILAELVREAAMALVLVSHDLGVVAGATDRLMVMHAGTRVEAGPTRDVLARPLSPYTAGLLAAMPRRRPGTVRRRADRLASIPGTVPSFEAPPPGCRFAPRCRHRIDACEGGEPAWRSAPAAPGRGVRCVRAEELAGEPW